MALPDYLRMLESGDPKERVLALDGLVHQDPKGARHHLLERLGDPDPAVRIAALRAGGKVDPPLSASEADGLLDDGDESVRLRAAEGLAQLPVPVEASRLADRLEHESSARVLATLLKTLGERGGLELAERLMAFLDHGDDRVRANAVEALDRLVERTLKDRLDGLREDRSNRVRANAALLLSRFDPAAAAGILKEMAGHASKWFRLSAAWAAGASGHPAMLQAVLPLLRDRDPDVQMQVIQAICSHPEPSAVVELRRLGKDQLDPDLAAYLDRALDGLGSEA